MLKSLRSRFWWEEEPSEVLVPVGFPLPRDDVAFHERPLAQALAHWVEPLEDVPLMPRVVAVALRRCRALSSLGSSRVSKALHDFLTQRRIWAPSAFVVAANAWRVDDVCSRSFAYACHRHRIKRRSRIMSLWGLGSRPSKTGIEH
jgi:hypothetical protein